MNSCIDEKIKSLIASIQKPYQQILVKIECPLDSGVKVECWRIINNEKYSQTILGGVRPFFQFVESAKKNEPNRKFNVVDITIDNAGKHTISFVFDENVQRQAEENIKQE